MFYQLPPVGEPVCLAATGRESANVEQVFSPYTPRFYNSGTAALAAAVDAAIQVNGSNAPEVILPGYGCPDLVSAVIYAGARPVLVDMEANRPWMDLDRLSARISNATVAIVAASLFGIPERTRAIREIAGKGSILLIEDSAQAFPSRQEEGFWNGDLVVLSFGRGKPVGLLGGGAVLYRDPSLAGRLACGARHSAAMPLHRLKARTYNLASSPRHYWITQGMPFLRLGSTRYRPLARVAPMSPQIRALLENNIYKYQQDEGVAQAQLGSLVAMLNGNCGALIDLPAVCNHPARHRLLRYPFLVDPERRDGCYRLLRKAGLGPSRMYPAALPRIRGLDTILAGQGEFPEAETFASRILTLPTHSRVRVTDIGKMRYILASCMR